MFRKKLTLSVLVGSILSICVLVIVPFVSEYCVFRDLKIRVSEIEERLPEIEERLPEKYSPTISFYKFDSEEESEFILELDLSTGRVKIKEGISLDEASLEFWKAVEERFPEICQICKEREDI